MIAGPNGSGKSTLTELLREEKLPLGRYINPDEIYQTLNGPHGDKRVRRAQAIAEERFEAAIRKGERVTFETVMSHESKIARLEAARARGYRIVIYFVALEDPTLNIERVRQRVLMKGHGVPEDRIVPRYERCMELLPQAIALCDRAVLFDNSYRVTEASRVMMQPFCQIKRTAHGDLHFYATDRELMRRQHEAALPRWSRGLITDNVLDRNELNVRRSTRAREARVPIKRLTFLRKYLRFPTDDT